VADDARFASRRPKISLVLTWYSTSAVEEVAGEGRERAPLRCLVHITRESMSIAFIGWFPCPTLRWLTVSLTYRGGHTHVYIVTLEGFGLVIRFVEWCLLGCYAVWLL
jgi:hypothetical protein